MYLAQAVNSYLMGGNTQVEGIGEENGHVRKASEKDVTLDRDYWPKRIISS